MREDPIEWTPEELRQIERQRKRLAELGEKIMRDAIENEIKYGEKNDLHADNDETRSTVRRDA